MHYVGQIRRASVHLPCNAKNAFGNKTKCVSKPISSGVIYFQWGLIQVKEIQLRNADTLMVGRCRKVFGSSVFGLGLSAKNMPLLKEQRSCPRASRVLWHPTDIGNTSRWLYHTPWRPLSSFYLSRTELQTFPWDMTMQTTKKRTKITKTNKTDNTADGDEWNENGHFNGFPLGIMNAVICYAIFHLLNSFDKLARTLWQMQVLWSIKKRRLTCIISPVLFKSVSHSGFTCPSFHWWPLVAKCRAAEGFKGTVQPKM